MASLDTVLQTIAPQRQVLAGQGGKNDIDADNQSGSGFDDILSQTGAKDDGAENTKEPETSGSKTIFSKQNSAFHQLKIQLSDKASSKETVSDPKVPQTTSKAADKNASVELEIPALATDSAAKTNDDVGQTDPNKLVPTQQKSKENAKIEVLNLSKITRAIEKNESDQKNPVEPATKKIDMTLAKEPKTLVGTEVKTDDELQGEIVVADNTEKPVKTIRHAADKKVETAKTEDANADVASMSQEGAKSILDILGGDPLSSILSVPLQSAAPKSQKALTTEDPATSVLEAVSQPVIDQKIRHADHGEDRKADNKIQKVEKQTETDKDTLFRFSKADGSEKPVDLRFGTSDKAGDTPAPITANKIENVVVLEARRYLALAPESNAFNLVSKIVGDKELSNAMTSSIIDPSKSAATSKVVNTLKLQMNPHDLGTVTATLRLRGEELSVAITVQNSAAYNHMTSDQDNMIDALRAQGFAVDQVTVQLVSADRSSFQDQQGQPSSQGQQQPARDGAAAQQGRQQGNGSPQDNSSSTSRQSNDIGVNTGASAAGGDRSDGQVYI